MVLVQSPDAEALCLCLCGCLEQWDDLAIGHRTVEGGECPALLDDVQIDISRRYRFLPIICWHWLVTMWIWNKNRPNESAVGIKHLIGGINLRRYHTGKWLLTIRIS